MRILIILAIVLMAIPCQAKFTYKTLSKNFYKLVNEGKLVIVNGKVSKGNVPITADDFKPMPKEIIRVK